MRCATAISVACLLTVTAACGQWTVIRGMPLPSGAVPRTVLLDIDGRRVLELQPGANDVRHLAPGVYFMCGEGSRNQGFQGPSWKVVIAE